MVMLSTVVDHLTGNRNVLDAIGHVTRKLSRGSSRFKNKNTEVELNALPLITEVSSHDQEDLFIKKLELCCTSFDFQDPTDDLKGKETKRTTLLELISYLDSNSCVLNERVYPEIVNMFSKNVFRVFPPPDCFRDSEMDDPIMEATWPHLSLTYDFMLKFIESSQFDSVIAKKYLNQNFVYRLLELLDSEDPRERHCLKTIIHRVYGKILRLRTFIRKQIGHIFLRLVYEPYTFNGVAELLEILGSIFNGFVVPLKEEHKHFLLKILMPLHKTQSLPSFHQQLTYCILQFIEKDPSLTEVVLLKLLRMWPKTCSNKEILFLTELEDLIDASPQDELEPIILPIFTRLGKCMQSLHFQVAEKALSMRNNEYIFAIMSENIEVVLPIIFPCIYASRTHWNVSHVNFQAYSFLKTLEELNPDSYYRCKEEFKQREAELSSRSVDITPEKNNYLDNNNCVVTSF